MPIICTQSPAENTSGGVKREREDLREAQREHGKKDPGGEGMQLLQEASEGWEERVGHLWLSCS